MTQGVEQKGGCCRINRACLHPLHPILIFLLLKNGLLSCSAAEPGRCLQVLGCFRFPEQQATHECSFNQHGGEKNAHLQKAKRKTLRQQRYYRTFRGQSQLWTTNEFITPLGRTAEGADQQGREALYLALRLINSHGILKIWTGLGGC